MKAAVLGCGSIGRRMIRNLISLGGHEIVAYDVSPETSAKISGEFEIECCAALDDIWPHEPEIVFVMTPTFRHIELARLASEHDCHLFLEKPLSHNMHGVRELIAILQERKLISMVGCNMRFHPGPRKVKDLIAEGIPGHLVSARIEAGSYLPGWRPWLDYRESLSAQAAQGGGATLECIHEIDLALWFFGPGKVVGAAGQKAAILDLEVDGLVEILLRHASGTLSSIHLNFLERDYDRGCKVIGSEGTLYWNFANPWVELRKGSSNLRYDLPAGWEVNDMYVSQLTYFLDRVSTGLPTFHSVEDSVSELDIALMARNDARGWN